MCSRLRPLVLYGLLFMVTLRAGLAAAAPDDGARVLPLAAAIAAALRVAPQVQQAAYLRAAGQYGARVGRVALLPPLSVITGRLWTATRKRQPL